jgi:hypothetical protein
MRRKNLFGKALSMCRWNVGHMTRAGALFVLTVSVALLATSAIAQTGGEGGIQGTVTDSTGAVVPNAAVTATAESSNVATTRTSSSAGLFTITPLIPDSYTVTVTAKGFQVLKQEHIVVTGLNLTGFNARLVIGGNEQTVTVTEAPPALDTTNATLGNVIDNRNYESLPLIMNGQQRDPTAFATLAPGAQGGARVPIFAGTGNYLGEVYLDGIPTTTANQQGDNRVVVNSIPVESVDQLRVISSGPSAEYQGAGAIAFTTKSGGNQYHGQVVDLVRNTIFDTWGFTAPAATKPGPNGTIIPAGKPVEHQNELSISGGGPIPFTRHKGFFFANYDKYHGRNGVNPSQFTVPTVLMKQGDFTELGSKPVLFDPTTNNCPTPTTCTRQPYMGVKNGLPTANIIPSSAISAISQYEQKFMPDPTSPAGVIANNYLAGGIPTGFDNWELTAKIDYDLTASQRVSFFYSHGVRQSVGYGANLPLPYTASDSSAISPTVLIFEHSIVLTPHMVNQFVYGFTRFPQPVTAPTDNLAPYRAGPDVGIGNLPPGQSSDNFPGSAFAATTAFPTGQSPWTENGASDATHNVVPNAFTLVDNLQWTKGKHSMTFGVQTQWLQDNTSSISGPSSIYTQSWNGNSTANYVGTSLNSTATGYSYASFLLGAVNSAGSGIQPFDETGGRYHPWSPYFQDDWKVTSKLTMNLGLRWDYLPPYHEVQDRFSFLNTSAINPLTGTPGQLEFAGNRGADISCQCRTPVNTYWKNFGPRLGLAYSVNDKTVIRAAYALAYSRAGGVGGRGGDSTGTGQAGFTANLILPTAIATGVNAGPSYYLNNSAVFQAAGLGNTSFGGPGFVLPAPATPSAAALTNGIGNYVSNGKYVTPGGAPGYADPYLAGRAPEFSFYNIGFQRSLTNDLTITVNYAGSQSHFVGGAGVPGFWSGQIDPAHVAATGSVLASDNATNILNAQATPANLAIVQAADPSVSVPYPQYNAAGAISSTATIGHMLRPYPQYSSPPSPTWDNIANISYNSIQVTLAQRTWKGLSYTLNYTYSKNLGDDSTHVRSAYAVPAAASSSGTAIPGNNRADRGLTATDTPQNLNIYGVDELPFGKGKWGSDNFFVRNIVGGWALSGIFTYSSGTPLQIIGSGCTTPTSGTCFPDINPNFTGSIRQNGSWGKGITAAHLNAISYLNSAAFQLPNAFPLPANAAKTAVATTKIGDAPRSGALNAWAPSAYNLNMAVQRSFNITPERVKFIFRADCFNVSNKVTFGTGTTGIGQTWSSAASSTFGQITTASGNRDWQFSGRVTF